MYTETVCWMSDIGKTAYSSLLEDFKLTDRDLSKPISEKNLDDISRLYFDWRGMPAYLGLKHGVVEDIQREHTLIGEKARASSAVEKEEEEEEGHL